MTQFRFALALGALMGSFASVFVPATAEASYMVIPHNQPIANFNRAERTHVIVVSRGNNDLGLLPQLAALTKADKLHDVYPNDQIAIFSPEESDRNLPWIQKTQPSAYDVNHNLDAKRLFDELETFSKIASLHTFGHGAIPEGVFLDRIPRTDKDIRWHPNSPQPPRLVGHFTDDAFVTLNNCNLGHSMASMLSSLWKVPVAGALTGSHFEVLLPNGQFDLVGHEAKWSKTTLGVLEKEKDCVRGCIRMRPDNGRYNGHYGKYLQGLPMYKFFCVGISEEQCLKGMAHSMIASVTATAVSKDLRSDSARESFSKAAREWLCPTIGARGQKNCHDKLLAIDQAMQSSTPPTPAERLFTTMSGGGSAQCTFEACYEKPQCMKTFPQTWACAKTEAPPVRSTTFVDEYMSFMKGFELLKAQASGSVAK